MSVHILEGTLASAQFDRGKVTLGIHANHGGLTLLKGARYPDHAAELLVPGKAVRLLIRKAFFDRVIHVVHDTSANQIASLEEHNSPQKWEFAILLGVWTFMVVTGVLLTLTVLLAIIGIPILIYALIIFPVQLLRDRRPLKEALSEFPVPKHEAPQYATKL